MREIQAAVVQASARLCAALRGRRWIDFGGSGFAERRFGSGDIRSRRIICDGLSREHLEMTPAREAGHASSLPSSMRNQPRRGPAASCSPAFPLADAACLLRRPCACDCCPGHWADVDFSRGPGSRRATHFRWRRRNGQVRQAGHAIPRSGAARTARHCSGSRTLPSPE